jgi:hypothetical protein
MQLRQIIQEEVRRQITEAQTVTYTVKGAENLSKRLVDAAQKAAQKTLNRRSTVIMTDISVYPKYDRATFDYTYQILVVFRERIFNRPKESGPNRKVLKMIQPEELVAKITPIAEAMAIAIVENEYTSPSEIMIYKSDVDPKQKTYTINTIEDSYDR